MMSCKGYKFIGMFALLSVIVLFASNGFAQNILEKPIMRYPDVHDTLAAFTYGDDIWTVSTRGRVARRITSGDGFELFPKFSPDGSMIAFTGEYDGNRDVYVMNIYGGDIKRLTYHPESDHVIGWHPIKNKIIFRSTRKGGYEVERLYMISPDGTGFEAIPIHEIYFGTFSADGSKIAYTKTGLDEATWKRYFGGTAENLYEYDLVTKQWNRLTDYKGTDRFPMWHGDKIYFSSDRSYYLNIYSYDIKTGDITQVTDHVDFDIREPSMSGNQIIYQLGGSLWLLNVNTGKTTQIPISIKTDLPDRRPRFEDVKKFITGIDCSPGGKRAAIVARGDIYTVPEENGPTRNLTQSSGSRERDAIWSPDGKWIAYLSDDGGEWQIHVIDPLGEKPSLTLTSYDLGYRHSLQWSPDSKKIAFADQTLTLYYIDVNTKKITKVDKADYESMDVSYDVKEISDYCWSPDSRFIAYSKMNSDLMYQIYIYSLETGEIHSASNGFFHDYSPVFTKDGQHLLFASSRLFDPTFGDFEWQMVYKNMTGIFSLALQKNGESIMPFRSDEAGDTAKKESPKTSAINPIKIDFDGIAERIEMLPLEKGNYRELQVNDDKLFYLNTDSGDFNFFLELREIGPRTLYTYSLDEREQEEVIDDITEYRLSADGSKIVFRKDNDVGIIDASATNSPGKNLDLSDLTMHLDPVAEWYEIYDDAWRMERDFYYDPQMRGLDWPAIGDKYRKLIEYASNRRDITFLIGELIAELSTSHTYVYRGESYRHAKSISVGMLGADYEVDTLNNLYRIKHIYSTPNWTHDVVAPLMAVGVNAAVGDYILEVDGARITADSSIYSYFQNLADKQVTLLINSRPDITGAREVIVKPISDEYRLRYYNWVEHNRVVTDSISGGLVGYLHFPDTYTSSAQIFPQLYYPQTQKKGLVIDARDNGGGLDPDIFLDRLNKKILEYWTRRHSHDQTTPAVVTNAHMVCITNHRAGSGGDQFPLDFRNLGMGPVIGTRTWGGLVGISAFYELVDGGDVTIPDYRVYNTEGQWIVENIGVEPDIIIELNPAEMERGYDAQLHRAVEMLLQKIKEEPRPWPQHEPFPKLK